MFPYFLVSVSAGGGNEGAGVEGGLEQFLADRARGFDRAAVLKLY